MSDITEPTNPETDQRLDPNAPVPHSGILGLEQPVDEFDNTTLQKAHESGLISPVPDAVPEHLVTDSNRASAASDSKKKGGLYLAVGGTIAALAGVIGMNIAKGGDEAQVPRVAAEATPPTPPEPTTPTTEFGPRDYNFHEGQEGKTANFEFAPEYAESDNTQQVLDILGRNLSKLYSERNPEYLQYYVADVLGERAERIKKRLNLLDNYYDITETYRFVSETQDATYKYVTVDWTENVEGDPYQERVILRLIKREFIENAASVDRGGRFIYAWVVDEQLKAPQT